MHHQTTAVFKEDGTRATHMADYIPKEELAKFMAACGNTTLAQQVRSEGGCALVSRGVQL